jgi:hypothetical protein
MSGVDVVRTRGVDVITCLDVLYFVSISGGEHFHAMPSLLEIRRQPNEIRSDAGSLASCSSKSRSRSYLGADVRKPIHVSSRRSPAT